MRAARIVSTGRGLALLLALVACATTVQTRSIQPSGFLGDYAQLEEGRGDRPLLVYLDPNADFARYRSLQLDPVTIWHEGGGLADVPPEQAPRLAATTGATSSRPTRTGRP